VVLFGCVFAGWWKRRSPDLIGGARDLSVGKRPMRVTRVWRGCKVCSINGCLIFRRFRAALRAGVGGEPRRGRECSGQSNCQASVLG